MNFIKEKLKECIEAIKNGVTPNKHRTKMLQERMNSTCQSTSAKANTPPELSLETLWNDFERRSHYEIHKKRLGISDARLLKWIGSIDYSGYTREKSLKHLIKHFVEGDENRILLRLSDWVPKIRGIASDWVLKHFKELPFESIRANSRLLLYLSRREMLVDDPAMLSIQAELVQRSIKEGRHAFFTLPAALRRYIFTLSLKDQQELREWLPYDREPGNRMLLLDQTLCPDLTEEEITALKTDKSVQIRRQYFYYRRKLNILPEKQEFLDMALETNAGMRSIAQFYLKKYYNTDAYDYYYRSQENDAFYYIADYAKETDADHFLAGLNNSSKSIRLLSLSALCKTAPQKLLDLDLQELLFMNRWAQKILIQHLPRLMSLTELEELKEPMLETGKSGLYLYTNMFHQKSYWLFLYTALDCWNHPVADDQFKDHVIKTVRNYGGSNPLPDMSTIILLKERMSPFEQDTDPRTKHLHKELTFALRHAL